MPCWRQCCQCLFHEFKLHTSNLNFLGTFLGILYFSLGGITLTYEILSSYQITFDMMDCVLCYSCHRFLFFFLGIQPPMASDSGRKSSAAEQELYRRWGEVLEKDNSLAPFGHYICFTSVLVQRLYFSMPENPLWSLFQLRTLEHTFLFVCFQGSLSLRQQEQSGELWAIGVVFGEELGSTCFQLPKAVFWKWQCWRVLRAAHRKDERHRAQITARKSWLSIRREEDRAQAGTESSEVLEQVAREGYIGYIIFVLGDC